MIREQVQTAIQCLRGQELIVDILSIRFSMDKLGRSAKGPLAVLEWELCDQPA
jgi:hypothetical protein